MTRLRPPTADDLADVFRIHGDPRTNRHNPAGPDRDLDTSRERLAQWLAHWEAHGFGYWVVEDDDGAVIGFTGVRHETWQGRPVLNLYYRFAPEVWGRGIASSVAGSVVRWAAEHHPDRPVLARTTEDDEGSLRTALAAGLVRRPDLEGEWNGRWTVVLGPPENSLASGAGAA